MRRWISLFCACTLLMAIAGGTFSSSAGANHATPAPVPLNDFSVEVLGSVPLANLDGSAWEMLATKVLLPPGAFTPEPGEHVGSVLLSVQSGGICYTLQEVTAHKEIKVTFGPSADVPVDCPVTTIPGCDDVSQPCALSANQTVYLPAGSAVAISQTGTASHVYQNLDGDTPAVVYLSILRPIDPEQGACGGGCY